MLSNGIYIKTLKEMKHDTNISITVQVYRDNIIRIEIGVANPLIYEGRH